MMNHDTSSLQIQFSLVVEPQANAQYMCRIAASNEAEGQPQVFYGQSQNHAIAVGLEHLAEAYRQAAEAEQNLDWEAMERSESGQPVEKRYHVVLHYERVAEEESKFEALHNTIIGNTVVENATIAIVQIASDLPVEAITR